MLKSVEFCQAWSHSPVHLVPGWEEPQSAGISSKMVNYRGRCCVSDEWVLSSSCCSGWFQLLLSWDWGQRQQVQKMSGILIYYPLPSEHQMSLAKRSTAVSFLVCAFQKSINFYLQYSLGKYRDTFLRSRGSNSAEREWCAFHGNLHFLIHLSLENHEFIPFLSTTEKVTGYFWGIKHILTSFTSFAG